jgi:hypothetical protein
MPMHAVKAAGQRPFDEPEAFAAAISEALNRQTGARDRALYDQFFSRAKYILVRSTTPSVSQSKRLHPSQRRRLENSRPYCKPRRSALDPEPCSTRSDT